MTLKIRSESFASKAQSDDVEEPTSSTYNSTPFSETSSDARPSKTPPRKQVTYRNKFLSLMSLRVRLKKAIESRFRSELLRRMVVTVILLFLSRAGHFLPIPGYDREKMRQSNLSTSFLFKTY